MTDQELSVIFERHAFDPWLPGNRQRNCLYVMDRMAFDAAIREAIATKTRELVDALRPWAAMSCWEDIKIHNIRNAERLVAEYDAKLGVKP